MIDRVVVALKTRGAEIVDPIEIPNLLGLLQGSGAAPNTNIYETEQAINGYLAQHPDTPVRTFRAMVESPLLIEPRRRALIYAVGHEPTEPGFPLQRLTQEALRTEVLKTMADNRLDAFLYATYDHAPTKLPHTTLGNNRQLAPVLGFPALAVPGGFSSDGPASRLDQERRFDDGFDALDFSIMRVDHMNRSAKSGGHDVGDHMPADRSFTRARTDDGERARRDQPVQAICRHRRILCDCNGLRRAGKHRPYPEIGSAADLCLRWSPVHHSATSRVVGHQAAQLQPLVFQKTSTSNSS
jgi:hypothetical protein